MPTKPPSTHPDASAKSRAGRKPGRTKAKLSLTINGRLVEKANKIAFKNQEALSVLVERALRNYIAKDS